MDESCLNSENQMPPRTSEGSDERHGEDRISNLHDSLLSYILSFVSTRDAVRTSTLSRRWKDVWKSVPILELNSQEFLYEDQFVDFVDKALSIHSGKLLRKFRLEHDFEGLDESQFELWFGHLVDCKVEHADVFNHVLNHIPIPASICSWRTLAVLQLYHVRLDVPESVSLPQLKILSFRDVRFWNASDFKVLMSGCPIIEEVYVTRNDWDNVFHLSSRSLKKLCIFNMDVPFSNDDTVVIEAPNLEYLCLLGQPFEILTANISASLVEADLDVSLKVTSTPAELQGKAANLSSAISKARSLTLSTATLSFFVAIHLQPAFAKLTYLDVEFPGNAWQLLPAFLANAPKLKTLIIGGVSTLVGRYKLTLPKKPQCLSSALQYFELRGSVTGRPIELKILYYLLKNSRVLKELKICVHRDFQNQRMRLCLFLSKLRAFRRRHHRFCQIVAVHDRRRVVNPVYEKGKFSVRDYCD